MEDEYIKADEVDQFLADPNGFAMRTILPRIAGIFQPLSFIQFPPMYWLANAYSTILLAPFLSAPGMKEMFEGMAAFCGDAQDFMAAEGGYFGEMAASGLPAAVRRRRVPGVRPRERLLPQSARQHARHVPPAGQAAGHDRRHGAASINLIIGACKATNTTRAFIPMHRGAGGFMSDEQFEKFYWPSFSALIYACIENGITPMPLFEGDYTPRLKYLATLPPGKVAAHFDKIDRKKFKEMCGDVMCFWGNVPPSLLATGTPQQVKDDVKELIDLFGDTGALILDSTVGIPDESKPENILALKEAATSMASSEAGRLGPPAPERRAAWHSAEKRFERRVALRRPDRVPLDARSSLQYFHTRMARASPTRTPATSQANLRLPEGCHGPLRLGLWRPMTAVLPSQSLEALGAKQVRWPGGDLPDDAPFQWVEDEYMKADEVRRLPRGPDGSRCTRCCRASPLVSACSGSCRCRRCGGSPTCTSRSPGRRSSRRRRCAACSRACADGRRCRGASWRRSGGYMGQMAALGYPAVYVGVANPPFDWCPTTTAACAGARTDMYRQPEKLVAMMEMLTAMVVAQAVGAAKGSGEPARVHPDASRRRRLHERRAVRQVSTGPASRRSSWACSRRASRPVRSSRATTRRASKFLAELPPGMVAAHFDRIDRKKFKEICGRQPLLLGRRARVAAGHRHAAPGRDEVKKLIDQFGDTGALMIDGGNAMPDEAKPENVMAMPEAVHEYGVF